MSYTPPAWLRNAGQDFGIPEMLYLPNFLDRERADALGVETLASVHWRRERLALFGRTVMAPRLTAWYGEAGASYRYGGVARRATAWSPAIRDLAAEVAASVAWRFNYALVNRYRDGADALGWHADDEPDLGAAPVIASVSVGAERVFRVRPRAGGKSVARALAHGSLVLMWGHSQRDYKHCLPRTGKAVGERLNFTFRLTRAP